MHPVKTRKSTTHRLGRLAVLSLAGAAMAIAATGAASAQTSDEWRMRVFNLYVAHIAVDVCEIDLSKAVHDRFDKATDVAEKRSGAST